MSFDRFGEKQLLANFEPIFLEEMSSVALMNRVDTKFVLDRNVFNKMLPELAEGYRALEVEGTRMSGYRTQYFDTLASEFYLAHHNGQGKRFKVRIREYVESGIFFLEIKKKFKGRTDKKRIKVDGFQSALNSESTEFVNSVVGEDLGLAPRLINSFDRITLVSKTEKERLTIDLNLGYTTGETEEIYDHIVIAELKQERINRESLFYRLAKKYSQRENSFSKYCVGAITLDKELKYNRFKEKVRLIEKLK